jgi:RND superfamily putative drug exporter
MEQVTDKVGIVARVASWWFDHRKLGVGIWIAALVVLTIVSVGVGSAYSDKFSGGSSESQHAEDLLAARFPDQAGASAQVVFHTDAPISDPATSERVTALVHQLQSQPQVVAVTNPADPALALSQVSRDGHIAFATVQFDKEAADLDISNIQSVVDTATHASAPGFEVEIGGEPVARVIQAVPGSSESIGIAAAIIILLIAFGSVIAMGLPIVTALFGIGLGFAFVSLLSRVFVVPSFGPELAAMIGIGVGIDYALFIVTRYRQGLGEGRDPREAVRKALDTSGRAVLFAGCTVVISLLGMFLLGQPFVYGLALGAISAVLAVLVASLTLLPGMLGFAGRAIDKWRVPGIHPQTSVKPTSGWYRWSRVVQRHPVILGGIALAILVVLALPVFSLRMAFSDAGNDPTSLTTRRAYDLLAQGFGPGANGPLVIAVDLPAGTNPAVPDQLADAARHTSGVAFVVPPQRNQAGDAATVIVIPTTSPQSAETQDLVNTLRSTTVPTVVDGSGAHAYVGGFTAGGIDAADSFSAKLPWVIGGVVLLSFLLLMAVFRSIAVPVKAAVMNLLSIGAAYGVTVAVFQWGWLSPVVGIDTTAPIEPWIPLMLFTILFGLSMDYEVFLLSRIREEWLRTGDNATSVADGLAQTARVITAAAAIMFCVFGSFVIGDLRILKVFGLGLAVAVLVDATIVRMVLVPATMELLGDANWWFPKWLDRLMPTVDVEGEIDLREPADEREPVTVS